MLKRSGKSAVALVLFVILLLSLSIATYVVMNSRVNKLSINNAALAASANNLTAELQKTNMDKEVLKIEAAKTKDDFDNFRKTVKQYFSTSKAIETDTKALTGTALEYRNLGSNNYSENKPILNKYDFQVGVIKEHLIVYRDLLKSNSALFEDLGLDTKKEIKGADDSIPAWQDTLDTLRFQIEALRFEGAISDSLGRSAVRTYEVNNVDYEVHVVAIDTNKMAASFEINGQQIIDLKVGANTKLPDGAELDILSFAKGDNGEDLVRFYLGK